MRKKKYILPVFDFKKWVDHIQAQVDAAPHGVVTLVVDLFCGAGGTSHGLLQATDDAGNKIFCIIAGINHDIAAIYSQSVNHPLAWYTCEDIRLANLTYLQYLVSYARNKWPQCPIIIWASLECTNLSNAKGGMSRDPDSRSLAEHMPRYLKTLQVDGLWIENVREFLQWGPLIEKQIMVRKSKKITVCEEVQEGFWEKQINEGWVCSCPLSPIKQGRTKIGMGKTLIPIKSMKATHFRPWHDMIKRRFKFRSQHAVLNCADYGVPQNRKRLFLIYMSKAFPIVLPKPTHAKKGSKAQIHGDLLPHVPVKECLDFSVEGRSIFEDGFISSDNTRKRVYAGLIKFVAGGKKNFETFVMTNNGGNPASHPYSIEDPARTIMTINNQSLVKAYFLSKHFSAKNNTDVNEGSSIEDPGPTVTTQNRVGLVETSFIHKYMGNNEKTGINNGADINDPANTITTNNRLSLVRVQFMDVVYGNGTPSSVDIPACTLRTKDGQSLVTAEFLTNQQGQSTAMSLDEASPTVLTRDKLALVQAEYFLTRSYSSGTPFGSVNNAAGSVTTNPKEHLVKVEPFVMNSNYENVGSSIDDPMATLTASRKHPYLVQPEGAFFFFNQYGGQHSSLDSPSPTIIARMDKAAPYLVSTESGDVLIPVFKEDSEMTIKLKEFMALYGIRDIKMRMLMIPELLAIQSFPVDYFLAGTLTDQKKFIGNAVPPLMAKKLGEALFAGMLTPIVNKFKKAA